MLVKEQFSLNIYFYVHIEWKVDISRRTSIIIFSFSNLTNVNCKNNLHLKCSRYYKNKTCLVRKATGIINTDVCWEPELIFIRSDQWSHIQLFMLENKKNNRIQFNWYFNSIDISLSNCVSSNPAITIATVNKSSSHTIDKTTINSYSKLIDTLMKTVTIWKCAISSTITFVVSCCPRDPAVPGSRGPKIPIDFTDLSYSGIYFLFWDMRCYALYVQSVFLNYVSDTKLHFKI